MKTTFSILLASAALATAQVKSNPDGTFTCTKPNASYCASDKSLDTDIIYRCTGTSAQPGRCGNNLAGEPPLGSANGGRCWQSSPTAGDAACEKNCVVYAATGSFTLPAAVCTPTYTASTAAPTTTVTFINPGPGSTTTKSGAATTTITFINPGPGGTTKSGSGTTTRTFIHSTGGDEDCSTSGTWGGHGEPTTVSSFVTVAPTKTGSVRPPPVTAGAAVNGVAKGVVGVMAVVGGLLL
ncbi:hypothetical protein B0T18DRAFT_432320 [Schizothecium vesticola]|uniref:Uncharacterized protein n=1 Tax=Schizothecium vesticola TaxID=314040 RepID=A0AA40K0A9_9PEZI|nr:hypothetical protein B0T18DRAFT_432320 [Schizothecium vesticola]